MKTTIYAQTLSNSLKYIFKLQGVKKVLGNSLGGIAPLWFNLPLENYLQKMK